MVPSPEIQSVPIVFPNVYVQVLQPRHAPDKEILMPARQIVARCPLDEDVLARDPAGLLSTNQKNRIGDVLRFIWALPTIVVACSRFTSSGGIQSTTSERVP